MKNIKLFLSVLLICVSFSASSQVVSIGSLDEVKDVQRFRFEADFSEAIIHGLSVSDFAIYEPDWDKDYDEILTEFVSAANEELIKVNQIIGINIDAEYTIRWKVLSINPKGNINSYVLIINCSGETIATISHVKADGGTFGSKLNLIKDGAEHTGKKFGKFVSKQIKKLRK